MGEASDGLGESVWSAASRENAFPARPTSPLTASPTNAAEVPHGFPWPIVLGIDPGTVVVGYGAIVRRPEGPRLLAAGVLRAPRSDAIELRLGRIRREVDALLQRLKPTVVVLEQAFAAVNVQSAFRIGEGRGVILGAAACTGAEIVQYAPAVMKKALVGNGQADKTQVAKCVASELGLAEAPKPLDATDALGLALTYIFKLRLAEALKT